MKWVKQWAVLIRQLYSECAEIPWDQSLSGKYPITWIDNSLTYLIIGKLSVHQDKITLQIHSFPSQPFLFPDLAPRSYSPLLWNWFPTIGWRRVCERYRSCIFLVRYHFLPLRLPSVIFNPITIKPAPYLRFLQLFPFMKILELQESIWRQTQISSVGTR